MLSGIGPKRDLEDLGVSQPFLYFSATQVLKLQLWIWAHQNFLNFDVTQITSRVDLPVGQKLVDHVFAPILFSINRNLFFYPERDTGLTDVFNYVSSQTGDLEFLKAGNVFFLNIFCASSLISQFLFLQGYFAKVLSETAAIYTKSSVARQSENSRPDLELIYGSLFGNKLPSLNNGRDYLAMSVFVIAPKSVGEFKLTSKDPDAEPLINPGYLTHPDDLEALVEGKWRVMAKSEENDDFGHFCLLVSGLKISVGLMESSAELQAAGLQLDPLPACAAFPFNSTSYWTCYAKFNGQSGYHFVGTCRMGADEFAVVDSKLRWVNWRGLGKRELSAPFLVVALFELSFL